MQIRMRKQGREQREENEENEGNKEEKNDNEEEKEEGIGEGELVKERRENMAIPV